MVCNLFKNLQMLCFIASIALGFNSLVTLDRQPSSFGTWSVGLSLVWPTTFQHYVYSLMLVEFEVVVRFLNIKIWVVSAVVTIEEVDYMCEN